MARCLDETEVLSFDGKQQLVFEHVSRRVQRDVEARDARVGGGQVRVVRRPDRH